MTQVPRFNRHSPDNHRAACVRWAKTHFPDANHEFDQKDPTSSAAAVSQAVRYGGATTPGEVRKFVARHWPGVAGG